MSKQKLLQTVFMLSSVLLGMGLGIGQATGKDQHGYILRYRVQVPDSSGITYSGNGISPAGGQLFRSMREEERSEWFTSLAEAQQRLNGERGCVMVSGSYWSELNIKCGITKEDFIGLYRAEEIAVSQVKVGSEKKLVQKTEEVEVDKLEWRVKP